jgi:hypothetical protein
LAVKLTPQLINEVCTQIERFGYLPERTLVAAGVTRPVAKGWLKRGRQLLESTEHVNPVSDDALLVMLAAEVDLAEAKVQNMWSDAWTAACIVATESGKAAGATSWANRIEKRFPEDFRHVGPSKPAEAPRSYDDVARARAEKQKKADSA